MIRNILVGALLMMANSAAADVATRIVVPSHDIKRGDVIGDSDLSYIAVTVAPAVSGIATSMNELDGMQARRLLRTGEPLRTDDVRPPILITKGSTVTMTFDAPGMTLNAVGKAMTEGGLGETLTVLNPVSYRQVTAVVTGSGQVRATDISVVVPQQLAATH